MLKIKHNEFIIEFEEFKGDISDLNVNNIFYNKKDVELAQRLKVKISISDNFDQYNILLIGYRTESNLFIENESFILCKDSLIVYFDGNIFSFSLPKLEMLWKKTDLFDVIGIYQYQQDLMVYDELSVLRVNKLGIIKWQYFGIDHFISYRGNKSFEMYENYIELRDSYENLYKIDYNGNVIDDSDAKNLLHQFNSVNKESFLVRFIKKLFNKSSL